MNKTLIKITIRGQADGKLGEMVQQVNAGFDGGRVNKTDLVSWIITHFRDNDFSSSIKSIREAHFDEIAYLQSVIKTARIAKRSSESPADLAKLLSPITNKREPKKENKVRVASEKGTPEAATSQPGTSK